MGIHLKQKGYFSQTFGMLDTLSGKTFEPIVLLYGQKGVEALKAATPKDSGKTAESWNFKVDKDHGAMVLNWYNTNSNEGANVAILLQYGHAGPGGVYVDGRDYINPAIQPVISSMKKAIRATLLALIGGHAAPSIAKYL